jgi:hypothetical protein
MRSRKVPPMRELPQVGDKPPGGRADAIRNRRQLLSAAAEFVTQVGAEKVTMDGLASYSGLGKGSSLPKRMHLLALTQKKAVAPSA